MSGWMCGAVHIVAEWPSRIAPVRPPDSLITADKARTSRRKSPQPRRVGGFSARSPKVGRAAGTDTSGSAAVPEGGVRR
jgi:hypothetical protein